MRMLLLLLFSLYSATALAAPPAAPQTLVIVSCKYDDLTGTRPLPDNVFPTKDWKDLEPRLNKDGSMICQRTVAPLEDAVAATHESVKPLLSNFGDWAQCVRASMMFAPDWERHNKPWVVVATGCPTPIMDDQGTPEDTKDDVLVGWHLPGCPSWLKCTFDESLI